MKFLQYRIVAFTFIRRRTRLFLSEQCLILIAATLIIIQLQRSHTTMPIVRRMGTTLIPSSNFKRFTSIDYNIIIIYTVGSVRRVTNRFIVERTVPIYRTV